MKTEINVRFGVATKYAIAISSTQRPSGPARASAPPPRVVLVILPDGKVVRQHEPRGGFFNSRFAPN